ncbi:hypothetical protein GE09DRAFT_1227543 [Coniochaeta sp. 2T2.1]|nr:hypothetical protein GE09DRAFT_1227543 [Coniochaeta sp. 2T2.1]
MALRPPRGQVSRVPHREQGWASPSGSRNVDAEYRYNKLSKGEDKACGYICICHLPWGEDEEEEEEEEEENLNKPKCDGAKTSVCQKPAAEHPGHKMLTTNAGLHFFNDYRGCGALEVSENLILDHAENEGDLTEQWAVIEGMAWFLLDDIDDGPCVDQTLQLAGRLFLSHLAKLESQNLLSPTSEYKDLGFVMALFITLANDSRRNWSLLESSAAANRFDDHIVAYARKHGIPLVGPADIDECVAKCDSSVTLPVPTAIKPEPWGFAVELRVHEKKYAAKGHGPMWRKGKKGTLGGDKFDVMAMTPAERKARHLDGKDPLAPKELEAIKIGLVPRRRSLW